MSLNVLKGYYAPMRYPSNWIANIKMFFKTWRWAYQRAKRGYADIDVWNFDDYLTQVMENGIKQLANQSYSFPGDDEFPTAESWTNYLNKIVNLLHSSREDTRTYTNIYEEDYDKWIETHGWNCDEDNPWRKAFWNRERELAALRQRDFDEAWEMIHHVFYHLWD